MFPAAAGGSPPEDSPANRTCPSCRISVAGVCYQNEFQRTDCFGIMYCSLLWNYRSKCISSSVILSIGNTSVGFSANQQSRVMCPFCGGFYDQRANSDFNMRRSSSVANGYLPHIVSIYPARSLGSLSPTLRPSNWVGSSGPLFFQDDISRRHSSMGERLGALQGYLAGSQCAEL